MKYLGDYHTHSNYVDGHQSPDEMAQVAYSKGLEYLGISEHLYDPSDGFGVRGEEIDKVLANIYRLKKEYAGKMQILAGFECENTVSFDYISDEQKKLVDYWIRSTHTIYKNGKAESIDSSLDEVLDIIENDYGGDWFAMLENYYINYESKISDKFDYTFIGHIDVITKYNEGDKYFDTHCDRYKELALYALKELSHAGLPFEINLGGINRGRRSEPYPQDFILKELHSLGGKIILSSDAHDASQIAGAFDIGARLAYDCGFRKRCILTKDGMMEVDLC